MRRPSIVFDDTEIHRYSRLLYSPFVTEVHSPDCYYVPFGSKHTVYPGYHCLAYLHPNHFKPNFSILKQYGLDDHNKVVLLRFVSWGAMHDRGLKGLADEHKYDIVKLLSKHARVLISSESELNDELAPYQLTVPIEYMHHVLASVDFVVSESATMSSEAAVLGVPAVYIDDSTRGYINELESKYRLCFHYKPGEINKIKNKVRELLSLDNTHKQFSEYHNQLMGDKIDVSSYQIAQIDRLGVSYSRQ